MTSPSQYSWPRPNLALIGFMGAGKSHVGRLLALGIGSSFLDLDSIIEERVGMTVDEIFKTRGETGFRDVEQAVFTEISRDEGVILSCGGGIILRDHNRRILHERCFSIWLKASKETLLERLRNQAGGRRPLLMVEDLPRKIHDLLVPRERYYSQADLILPTDQMTPDEVARKIRDLVMSWKGKS